MRIVLYVLFPVLFDGGFCLPGRSKLKSKPVRAPLSTSMSQLPTNFESTEPIHRLQNIPQQTVEYSSEERQQIPPLRTSFSSSTQIFYPDSNTGNTASTSIIFPEWQKKRLRREGGPGRKTRYRTEAAPHIDNYQFEKGKTPSRAAKRISQEKTKVAMQTESTNSDLEAVHSTTSQDQTSSSLLSSDDTLIEATFKLGSKFNMGSTSSTIPSQGSKRKGKSRWTGPVYSTAAKERRRKLFDNALKSHNLSIFNTTPQEFSNGIKAMKIEETDQEGLSGMARSLLARNHVIRNAPNQEYIKAYTDHTDALEKENDKRRFREFKERQKLGIKSKYLLSASSKEAIYKGRRFQTTIQRNQKSRRPHDARDERRWARTVSTIKRLEEKGYNFKVPLDELESDTRGACLDDVDATTCSRLINMYIRRTRGDADWQKLTKLKDKTTKRLSARKRAKAFRQQQEQP